MSKLLPGVSLLVLAITSPAAEVSARWEGAVQLPGREIRLVVDLAQDSAGKWTGSAIFPGFDVKGAPLAEISVNGADVGFVIKGALGGPKFIGKIAAGAFTGDYQQGGNTARFALHSTGPAQVDTPRQSTAIRPELAGDWQGDMVFVGNPVRVRLTLANQQDGKATGKFVVNGRRETILPVDLVTQEADLLTLEIPDASVTYDGRYHSDSREISGTFQQGPYEALLVLRPAPKP